MFLDPSASSDRWEAWREHEAILNEQLGEPGGITSTPRGLVVGQHPCECGWHLDARFLVDLLSLTRPRHEHEPIRSRM